MTSYIRQEEMWRRGLLEAAGKERGASALVQAARLLSRPGSFMGGILRKDLLDPWDEAAGGWRVSGLAARGE